MYCGNILFLNLVIISGAMDSRMQDSHKSFLIKDLLGDVLRPGAAGAVGMYLLIHNMR